MGAYALFYVVISRSGAPYYSELHDYRLFLSGMMREGMNTNLNDKALDLYEIEIIKDGQIVKTNAEIMSLGYGQVGCKAVPKYRPNFHKLFEKVEIDLPILPAKG